MLSLRANRQAPVDEIPQASEQSFDAPKIVQVSPSFPSSSPRELPGILIVVVSDLVGDFVAVELKPLRERWRISFASSASTTLRLLSQEGYAALIIHSLPSDLAHAEFDAQIAKAHPEILRLAHTSLSKDSGGLSPFRTACRIPDELNPADWEATIHALAVGDLRIKTA